MSTPRPVAAPDEVLALERELQTPGCRADPARLDELLAADFLEIGASGRLWDRAAVLQHLREESDRDDPAPILVSDLVGRQLAPGVVQVSWTSDRAGRRARRASIWCRRGGRWQLVHHQGTPDPG